MTERQPAYNVHHVSFAYSPEKPVLSDLSFSILPGSWVSLVGPNGCGKSTLAKLLGGLLTMNEGTIEVDGILLSSGTIGKLRPRMGMVFQNPDNQFIGSTVEEDIAFGLENRHLPRKEMKKRVRSYAEKLEIDHLLNKHPSELSGGQKQRVAVASILALEPEIVIFDEASSMLDEKARGELLDILREMKAGGRYTMISITHDAEEIMASDRAIVLSNCGIAADLTPWELFHDSELLQTCRLIAPYSIRLEAELYKLGITMPNGKQQSREMADQIWQLFSKK
ncbi:ATP-binding cassette domain-containing protein [Paenibacillus massiliensis]|uniref:ATP-binding cassette domain-containing protein n=1 Tax=Paenibacillus massiliensis TaxID=225917 RepID=UPI000471D149|nr:ATP-binding cassette domain-containing protein [Paenibacillus massiliensis]